MFYTQTSSMFQQGIEGREGTQVPLHHIVNDNGEVQAVDPTTGYDVNGTWGERDVGGPVNIRNAMLDYEEMRRDLTSLSKTRSRKSARSQSRARSAALNRQASRASEAHPEEGRDVEAGVERDEAQIEKIETPGQESDDTDSADFELGDFLKDGHFEKRKDGESAKKVGVVYKNLTVKGVGATATFVKTLPSAIIGVSQVNTSQ